MATYFWVGGTGTWNNASTTNWSATSGGAGGSGPPNSADNVVFDANSGTGTCTTEATAAANRLTQNAANINLTLGADLTINEQLRLYAGTLTLGSYKLQAVSFDGNNPGVARTLAFGTGNITLTGNAATIFNTTSVSGLTVTGTPNVNLTYSGSTGTRNITTGGASEAQAFNFIISAGSDTIGWLSTTSVIRTLNLTGFSGTLNNTIKVFYGNLIIPSTATINAGTNRMEFAATSGTQQITTNGKTLDFPLTFSGIGGTYELQDNLTQGSTRTLTLTAGTLNLKNNTLSIGLFSSSGSGTRSIGFGTGNITLTGSGTVWNTGTVTNFSYTGTSTINVSNNSATATTVTTGALSEAQALNFNYTVGTYTLTDTNAVYKNVNFTGFTGTVGNAARTIYGNLTLEAGSTLTAGANATTLAATSGTQQITTNGKTLDFPLTFNGIGGTFAFQDALTQGSTRAFTLTNGTLQLKNGVTSTVGAFATSGTNQKFLRSTSAGNQATISQASGSVDASYLNIQDSNAIGGATWNAYANQQNIDAGNNDGWDFGISPVVAAYEYTYDIRSFTQPKRF